MDPGKFNDSAGILLLEKDAYFSYTKKFPQLQSVERTTRDISARGAFFPSEHSFEKGTQIKVDLILTPEKPWESQVKRALIKVIGTVLRKEAEGMAVHFEKNYKLAPLN